MIVRVAHNEQFYLDLDLNSLIALELVDLGGKPYIRCSQMKAQQVYFVVQEIYLGICDTGAYPN